MQMYWQITAIYSTENVFRFKVAASANFLTDLEAISEELIMCEYPIDDITTLRIVLSSS